MGYTWRLRELITDVLGFDRWLQDRKARRWRRWWSDDSMKRVACKLSILFFYNRLLIGDE